jgi:hypothetical protein
MKTAPAAPKPRDLVPETCLEAWHRWAGKPPCHAWSHGNRRQCNRIPLRGKSICLSHSGAGGSPPRHGHFSLPAKLDDDLSLAEE